MWPRLSRAQEAHFAAGVLQRVAVDRGFERIGGFAPVRLAYDYA